MAVFFPPEHSGVSHENIFVTSARFLKKRVFFHARTVSLTAVKTDVSLVSRAARREPRPKTQIIEFTCILQPETNPPAAIHPPNRININPTPAPVHDINFSD